MHATRAGYDMDAVVWFRRDLRLNDNPAWSAATSEHERVTPLFVVDPDLWDRSGAHRRNQLAAHLGALDVSLASRGGRLLVLRGDPVGVVTGLGAAAVYWNADASPYGTRRDRAVAAALRDRARIHDGCYVHPPGAVRTATGANYKVFTPFWRKWREIVCGLWPEAGQPVINADPGVGVPEAGPGLMEPGEAGARLRLERFLDRVDEYGETRDRPGLDATSRLSADLKFGTIDARRLRAVVGNGSPGRVEFVRQLAWRDFWADLLVAVPGLVAAPMRSEYATLTWREDPDDVAAWREGRTGYPIVDAGMRQLRTEGWMHNRLRMITASFLVKDLLIDWRVGERWFRDQLVDADLPQNVGNWQWVAGTGADAAPYFRVFNPVTQSRRFDPDGHYIRRYVPELGDVDAGWIHAPWEAGPVDLAAAGIRLGHDYPWPIVDHREARERTLEAYRAARASASGAA